jgi:hypothetical protein
VAGFAVAQRVGDGLVSNLEDLVLRLGGERERRAFRPGLQPDIRAFDQRSDALDQRLIQARVAGFDRAHTLTEVAQHRARLLDAPSCQPVCPVEVGARRTRPCRQALGGRIELQADASHDLGDVVVDLLRQRRTFFEHRVLQAKVADTERVQTPGPGGCQEHARGIEPCSLIEIGLHAEIPSRARHPEG